jgi:DNA processing protein
MLKRLQGHFGTLTEAWQAGPQTLRGVEGFGPQTIETVVTARRTCRESQLNPEKLLHEHQQENPYFWTPADTGYPQLLLEIPDPPPVLYYRGNGQSTESQGLTPAIAIIGTREPTDYGKRWTRKISAALAQKGFTIVSGLAEGIDTEAHWSCLEAGGRALAVLGTGVDVVYPLRNNRLYRQILSQGLVLSEYPAGTQPERVHFPRRNRIIAGLSRAVLVMEAPSKSGALITAHLANDYCRDVYVLPGSLDNPRSLGCLGLVSQGAQLILNEGHLLEMLSAIPQLDQSQQSQPMPSSVLQQSRRQLPVLEPQLEQILQALIKLCEELSQESVPFDLIVQNAALGAGHVSSALLQLELLGLVSQLPGMRYQPLC